MSTRWWAPSRPTLTPDAVVMALMETGDDPVGDLGGTLLGAHRAGAAACEWVAKGAVPSEQGLLEALATCRLNLADQMVTSISKSLSGIQSSPNYAGLFVRDVFDDAEQGALTLFQRCISKGVSPPMAASRVGAVFGVPAGDLGKYQVLATDPKTNPVTLADAADRALLTYVSKLVTFEQPVEFSKAGVVDTSEFDPLEHPRGARGRFRNVVDRPKTADPFETAEEQRIQRLDPFALAESRKHSGGGGQAAPTVATEPAVTQKVRPVRPSRPVRPVRPVRTLRPTGKTRELKRSERSSSRPMSERQRILSQAIQAISKPFVPQKPKSQGPIPDFLQLPNPTDIDIDYGELWQPVAFTAPGQVSNDFQWRLTEQAGGQAKSAERIFRIGHLLQQTGSEVFQADHGRANRALKEEAEAEIARVSMPMHRYGGEAIEQYTEPVVREITDDEVPVYLNQHQTETALEHARTRDITVYHQDPGGKESESLDELEDSHVEVYEGYTDVTDRGIGTTSYVVHFQAADERNMRNRPRPTVSQFIVESDAVGFESGGSPDEDSNKAEFMLNPNVAYKLVTPPGYLKDGVPKPKKMWDNDLKVVVLRYYLRPIAEEEVDEILGEIHKADIFVETEHWRDAGGQFTDMPTRTTVKPPQEAPAQARPVRPVRPTRPVRPVRAMLNTNVPARSERQRTRTRSRTMVRSTLARTPAQKQMVRAISRAMADSIPIDDRAALPALDDRSRYLVMTSQAGDEWAGHEGGAEVGDFERPSDYYPGKAPFSLIEELLDNGDLSALWNKESVRLPEGALETILTVKAVPVGGVSAQLSINVEEELWPDFEEVAFTAVGSIPYDIFSDEYSNKDNAAIAKKSAELFAANRNLDQIQIEPKGSRLIFRGNSIPAHAQHLIQIDPDLNIDDPIEITYLGEYRAHELQYDLNGDRQDVMSIGFLNDEPHVTSAKMHYFKITRPVVHHHWVSNVPRG